MAQFETPLQGLLDRVNFAVRDSDLKTALRYADAAARKAPDSPDVLQLLGGIFLLCGNADRAVETFEDAFRQRETPDIAAGLIDALLAANLGKDAQKRLHAALIKFAVGRGDRLAQSARKLILQCGTDTPGWVGVSPSLEIWGEVIDRKSPAKWVCHSSQGRLAGLKVFPEPSEPRVLSFEAPRQLGLIAEIDVRVHSTPLLGSGAPYPPEFSIDGRSWIEGGEVRGWVSMGWLPLRGPDVVLADTYGWEAKASVSPDLGGSGRHSYSIEPGSKILHRKGLSVSVITPDGRREPLPDSPLMGDPLPAPSAETRFGIFERAVERLSGRRRSSRIDVIVPVYKGLDETIACITSVADTVGPEADIIVVDDASDDAELALALRGMADAGVITLLRNRRNLGFPATVNRGLALHRDRDVVILNSDAQVFPGWLDALRAAAYDNDHVGTVTPLTNSGSIANYPMAGSDCDAASAAATAELAARVHSGAIVDAPTGVGFCMFIRRDCLAETGPLDAASFEKGYGEENDFCLRASRLGWRHVIAPGVFVRHIGGRSFGKKREALVERNLRILNRRHPEYETAVDTHQTLDPLAPFRRGIDEALVKAHEQRFRLLISLALPGGVERFVKARSDELQAQGYKVLVLRPSAAKAGARLEVVGEPGLTDLVYSLPQEHDALLTLLKSVNLDAIELHHFLDLDPDAIDLILGLGAPYDVYIHDYTWICSRITLIGADGRYCGEPQIKACESCAKKRGGRLEAGLTIRKLRLRSERWLRGARRVITPARDVAARLQNHFPAVDVEIDQWEPAITPRPRPVRDADDVVKVAVIGAIGEHKGYKILLACAEDAAERQLPIEFVVIGFTEDDQPLLATGKVFITGEYHDREVEGLIGREAPDLGFFPSIWPETWCYSLSHALRCGLSVAAFDIGAIAERLGQAPGAHRLLPLQSDARQINDCLLSMVHAQHDPGPEQNWPHDAHVTAPILEPIAREQYQLAAVSNLNLSQSSTFEPLGTPMQDTKSALTVSVEVLPLNKGIYQFVVQSAAPKRVGDEGELILPAMHVGPGPGVACDHVEVMTGLRNEGAWLYEPRDTLIMKIKSSPTLILLTSVRSEGMAPLDIAVERIDNKKQTASAAPDPAPALPALAGPTPAKLAEAAAWSDESAAAARKDQLGRNILRAQIMAHIKDKGDTTFVDTFWAGALGEKLPIEAFSIIPLEGVSPDQIEYKGLTSTGVETAWTSGGAACGSRGMEAPLIGFAIRLKAGADDQFDCEYRGAFRSGKIVGPVTNGAPCRALATDDYLEGIQLTIVERRKSIKFSGEAPERLANGDGKPAVRARKIGPKFSVFREDVE